MNWETILCLGDSITIGSRSYLGYPEYCGDFLSAKTNKKWNVVNHAVAGYTVIDLVRSVDANVANLRNNKPEIITILIGTNDLKLNTTPEDFKIAYLQLLIKAKLIIGNNNIVLIKIPALMEGIMLPYKIAMNKTILVYNQIIEDIGKQENLTIIDIETEPNHFYDGVHLNDLGSRLWGEALAKLVVAQRTQ